MDLWDTRRASWHVLEHSLVLIEFFKIFGSMFQSHFRLYRQRYQRIPVYEDMDCRETPQAFLVGKKPLSVWQEYLGKTG